MKNVRCDVCGRKGPYAEGPLPDGPPSGEAGWTVQCPRCRRFICSRHLEPLPDGRLGCPFDPGVFLDGADASHGD